MWREAIARPELAQQAKPQPRVRDEQRPLLLHLAAAQIVLRQPMQVEVADRARHGVEQPLRLQHHHLAQLSLGKPHHRAEAMEVEQHALDLGLQRQAVRRVRQPARGCDRAHLGQRQRGRLARRGALPQLVGHVDPSAGHEALERGQRADRRLHRGGERADGLVALKAFGVLDGKVAQAAVWRAAAGVCRGADAPRKGWARLQVGFEQSADLAQLLGGQPALASADEQHGRLRVGADARTHAVEMHRQLAQALGAVAGVDQPRQAEDGEVRRRPSRVEQRAEGVKHGLARRVEDVHDQAAATLATRLHAARHVLGSHLGRRRHRHRRWRWRRRRGERLAAGGGSGGGGGGGGGASDRRARGLLCGCPFGSCRRRRLATSGLECCRVATRTDCRLLRPPRRRPPHRPTRGVGGPIEERARRSLHRRLALDRGGDGVRHERPVLLALGGPLVRRKRAGAALGDAHHPPLELARSRRAADGARRLLKAAARERVDRARLARVAAAEDDEPPLRPQHGRALAREGLCERQRVVDEAGLLGHIWRLRCRLRLEAPARLTLRSAVWPALPIRVWNRFFP